MTEDAMVEVTQEDREAAALTVAPFDDPFEAQSILRGEIDKGRLVQAFARHRIAAEARQHGDGGREAIFRGALDEALYCLSQFKLLAKITDRQKARLQEIIDCARSRIKAIASPALPDTTGRELVEKLRARRVPGENRRDPFSRKPDPLCHFAADWIERALSRQRVDDRMREALTFYRDAWQNDVDAERTESGWTGSIGPLEPADALLEDKGERARAALEGADHG